MPDEDPEVTECCPESCQTRTTQPPVSVINHAMIGCLLRRATAAKTAEPPCQYWLQGRSQPQPLHPSQSIQPVSRHLSSHTSLSTGADVQRDHAPTTWLIIG
uniref:Uncharacterized protein n=1 Tax=Knipowitschia caucasica TaxID=637954 RepID=A0AAV2LNU5_KNICA